MKEVLYTISGKRLPVVFHIGARALTSQSLNVHAGHDDVMGVEDVGWGMLCARSAQAAGDLSLIARRVAEETSTPFFNVQDGFLTTHTVENVNLPEPELMKEFIKNPNESLTNLFDPYNPVMTGVVQNQDSYMKGKIAQRAYYAKLKPALKVAMADYEALTGRHYDLVESYKMDDAEYAIIGMGTIIDTTEATVDWMRENLGMKVGAVHVTSFRPFPSAEIVDALKHVKAFSVLERMDNPLSQSNPLTREIKAAFADAISGFDGYPAIDRIPQIYSGSVGLGSRDVRAGDLIAIVRNMQSGDGKRYFVTGIKHETALEVPEDPDIRAEGSFSMRGHSVGGFGSVTTNKVIATIAGDVFDKRVQAYPKYGSEKKGLPTAYYLTVSDERIRTHAELNYVDFIPVNDVNAFMYGNPLVGLMPGGTLFINSPKETGEEVWYNLPAKFKTQIRDKNIRVMVLDAAKIAREESPTADLEVRMQGVALLGVFMKATPFAEKAGLSYEDVMDGVEKAVRKYFGKRGEAVVQANLVTIRRGYTELFDLSAECMASDATNPVMDPRADVQLFL